MKSTEFIVESEVTPYQSKILTTKKAVAALNKYCKQSLATIHAPLWRGMSNHTQPIVSIDPSTGERKSQNTSNYYTQIIDNSPYFTGWPKRSQSLICSTDYGYAYGYTQSSLPYAIFPYDGVPIAVCPGKDMWETPAEMPGIGFVGGQEDEFGEETSMATFNHILGYTLDLPANYSDMVRAIKTEKFKRTLQEYRAGFSASSLAIDITPKNFLEYIQERLSPKACGFRLLPISQFAANPPDNKECWVGGPVIAIRKDVYDMFVDAVMKDPAAAGNPLHAPAKSPYIAPKSKKPKLDKLSSAGTRYYDDAGATMTPEEYAYWLRAKAGEFDVDDEDIDF